MSAEVSCGAMAGVFGWMAAADVKYDTVLGKSDGLAMWTACARMDVSGVDQVASTEGRW